MTYSARSFKRVKPALGTFLEISVAGLSDDGAIALTERAFAEALKLERTFSFHDPESELSRLNSAPEGHARPVSPELWQVLFLGDRVSREFPGTFRLMPDCPHGGACYVLDSGSVVRASETCCFDLGGIAKGFIVDRASELLEREAQGARWSVNAGGDLRCSDEEEVELRIPGTEGEQRFVVSVAGGAVATSSRQGAHTAVGTASASYPVDLGQATGGARAASATVVATSCAVADALTKAVLLGAWEPSALLRYGVSAIYLFDEKGKRIE